MDKYILIWWWDIHLTRQIIQNCVYGKLITSLPGQSEITMVWLGTVGHMNDKSCVVAYISFCVWIIYLSIWLKHSSSNLLFILLSIAPLNFGTNYWILTRAWHNSWRLRENKHRYKILFNLRITNEIIWLEIV